MNRLCPIILALALAGPAPAGEYAREWQSPNLGLSAWGGANGFDLDGSGHPNLWARGGSQVTIYDAGFNPWWTINCPGYTYPALAIPRDIDGDGLARPVDINGDGTGEIVVGAYQVDGSNYHGRFWIYDVVTRRLEWESPVLQGFTGHVQLEDVDGDGRHEIIVSRYNY